MSEGSWTAILDEINHCNKCGFCLPACPTYQITGSEMASPRGRIAMVEALARGEIGVGQALEDALTYCLGCRACETACPSGVHYARILEAGREALYAQRPQSRQLSLIPRQMLKLVKTPRRMARMVRLAERVKSWPLPRGIRQFTPMLGYRVQTVVPADPPPNPVGGVAFFEGCVMSAVFPDANRSAQELLTMAGLTVSKPEGQGCCGALHLHAGRLTEAKELAQANIAAFEVSGEVPIANTAGGCGAMLSEYDRLLADDPFWRERAARFSRRIRDWSTVLRQSGRPLTFLGEGERVTLQNSCHLVNVEKAGADPVALIRQVEGDEFVPLAGQDSCCGSAGIYNLQHTEWALKILDQKMEQVDGAGVDRILVNNPGCQLQMQWGVNRLGPAAQRPPAVEHVARYLYRAARRAKESGRTQAEVVEHLG